MDVDIAGFDPAAAGADALRGLYEVRAAVWRVDFPEDPTPTYDSVIGRLLVADPDAGPQRFWAAHAAGRIVGTASLGLPAAPNGHLGIIEVQVHPDARRHGIGLALMRAVLPAVRSSGRPLMAGGGIKEGSSGAAWAEALGFETTHRYTLQRLYVADVDESRWLHHVPDGYTVERWTGRAPDDLISSYALARSAIHDAPTGDSTFQSPRWTVERIRDSEAELDEQQVEQRVVVAVHNESKQVAGLTILERHPHQLDRGRQQDTAVLRQHRGAGLGRCIKAAMLRWTAPDWPDMRYVFTASGAENTHMLDVNRAIGFTDVRTMRWVEQPSEKLLARVDTLADRGSSGHSARG